MYIKVAAQINQPVATVWEYVASIDRHVEWMADAESIEFTTPHTSGVGAAFVCVTKVGPFRLRDIMTVTEWSTARVIGIQHVGLVTGHGHFLLNDAAQGMTEFTWEEWLTFPWWMGGPVGAFAAKPVLRWIWKRNLQRCKARCEVVA